VDEGKVWQGGEDMMVGGGVRGESGVQREGKSGLGSAGGTKGLRGCTIVRRRQSASSY